MDTLKVFLVDDHLIIRDGIRSYLDDDDKYTVVGEANSGAEALEMMAGLQPHLVIMDISMGGIDGIECTRQINQQWPKVKIVALTMLNEPQYIRQMMDAGASAYLLKNSDHHEVKAALEAAMRGETYYSPEVTRIVMNSLTSKKPSKKSRFGLDVQLTAREKEVLELILKEFSNQEIADKLFISSRTVEVHKRNLLEKTGAKNTAGLVLYAVNNNLFEQL